ncbi:MAG: polysaccharide biosynthesis/export family protein [Bacteroidota bacterium]|nr:polysaccharide biosynthesis/export family protein [Bacteroidota bacterium]
MNRFLLFGLLVLIMATSCVPRKRLTYFQDWGNELKLDSNGYQVIQYTYYKVQRNDLLSIQIKTFNEEIDKFFNVSENQNLGRGGGQNGNSMIYFTGYSVDDKGDIQLPILQNVNVEGLTLEEITKKLEGLMEDYFNETSIYVKVQLAGIRYTVVGEVNAPGQYFLYQNQANVFEALAQAGDIGFLGNRFEVMIVRQTPEGVKYYELDMTDKTVVQDPRYMIQPNDIINVKPLKQKSWGIGQTGFQTFVSAISVLSSSLALYLTIQTLQNQN